MTIDVLFVIIMSYRRREIFRTVLRLSNVLSTNSSVPTEYYIPRFSPPECSHHAINTVENISRVRRMSTEVDTMSEAVYHKEADHTLDILCEELERLVEDLDIDDGDIELSQGVLTLKLGSLGTYVINKQTPNKQLWLSSPVSGPVRYDFVKGFWMCKRDGHFMHERLQNELEALTGAALDVSPCSHCGKLNACLNNFSCVSSPSS